jgi:predicted NBD/HSP70 family sugar kinase
MAESSTISPTVAAHGASRLISVDVDCYNVELKDDDGTFLGDRASKGAFRDIIENCRKPLRKIGVDPFDDEPSRNISKEKLDALLSDGSSEAARIVQCAIEDFAHELAMVMRRFLRLEAWRDTECIVVGGGLRATRVGERAIGRSAVMLKADKVPIDLVPISHDPTEAGLIGAAYLAPQGMLEPNDAILAVDIGGTNIRAGVVVLNLRKALDLSKATVWKFELWRHADENNPKREDAVERLTEMLKDLIARAGKEGLRLAPFIGIGCPGVIEADGAIDRGAQNLPGNWESDSFNLPTRLRQSIPKIGPHETMVLMHNDAVVQGLSAVSFMQDVKRWGILTIGTGLGNARFTNHSRPDVGVLTLRAAFPKPAWARA